MCYRSPGPRCSKHAQDALNKAQGVLNRLVKEEEQVIGAGASKEILDEYASKIDTADTAYKKSRLDFDATPAGMKTLANSIRTSSITGSEDYRNELLTRLKSAKDRRSQQLAAYRAYMASGGVSSDDLPGDELADQVSEIRLTSKQRETIADIRDNPEREYNGVDISLKTLNSLKEAGLITVNTKTVSRNHPTQYVARGPRAPHLYKTDPIKTHQAKLTDLGKRYLEIN